jgi:hypothetical protein
VFIHPASIIGAETDPVLSVRIEKMGRKNDEFNLEVWHEPHWQHLAPAHWSTSLPMPNLIQVWCIHYRIHRGADEASQITGCSEQRQKHTYNTVLWINMGIYGKHYKKYCYHNQVAFADPDYEYEDEFAQTGYVCSANLPSWSYTPTAQAKENSSMLKLTR